MYAHITTYTHNPLTNVLTIIVGSPTPTCAPLHFKRRRDYSVRWLVNKCQYYHSLPCTNLNNVQFYIKSEKYWLVFIEKLVGYYEMTISLLLFCIHSKWTCYKTKTTTGLINKGISVKSCINVYIYYIYYWTGKVLQISQIKVLQVFFASEMKQKQTY